MNHFPFLMGQEARLLRKEGYFHDVYDTYLRNEGKEMGTFEYIVGGGMAAGSVATESLDRGVSYVIGQEYQEPEGMAGRIRRDTWQFVKDVFHMKPLHAVADAVRVVGDAPMDAGDALFGYHQAA